MYAIIHLLTAFYLQVNHFSALESGFFLHQNAINRVLNNWPQSHQHAIQHSKQAKNRVSFVTIVTPTNPPPAPPEGRGDENDSLMIRAQPLLLIRSTHEQPLPSHPRGGGRGGVCNFLSASLLSNKVILCVRDTDPTPAPPLHGRGVDYSACCFQIAISNKLITDEHSAKRLTTIPLVADEHPASG